MAELTLVVLAGLLVVGIAFDQLQARARDHDAEVSHRRLLAEIRRQP